MFFLTVITIFFPLFVFLPIKNLKLILLHNRLDASFVLDLTDHEAYVLHNTSSECVSAETPTGVKGHLLLSITKVVL